MPKSANFQPDMFSAPAPPAAAPPAPVLEETPPTQSLAEPTPPEPAPAPPVLRVGVDGDPLRFLPARPAAWHELLARRAEVTPPTISVSAAFVGTAAESVCDTAHPITMATRIRSRVATRQRNAVGTLFRSSAHRRNRMTQQTIIRQGDVLVVPCKAIPSGARPVEAEGGRLILARGEATGHHHSVALNPRICMFRDDGAGSGGQLYLRADAPVSLEHQEHTALEIAPGSYEVRIQRTVQTGVARRVAD